MLVNRRPLPCRGATLIEVLVTIVLLSFGALSLAGLQAYSVAAGKNAANRGLATAMATDLADMIRANPAAKASYSKAATFNATAIAVPTPEASEICLYPNCTPQMLAVYDAAMFNARLKAMLRAGTYAVVPVTGSPSRIDIYIMWEEQRAAGVKAADEASFDSCPKDVQEMDPLPRCFYVRVNL